MLTGRQSKILERLVETYIQNKQPVGSEMLVRMYRFPVSTATMRNEFAALTDMGYLAKPHVSAGRVPTTKAYRFFVDSSSGMWESPSSLEEALEEEEVFAVDAFMAQARNMAKLLASVTDSVAVISFRGSAAFEAGLPGILGEPEFQESSALERFLTAVEMLVYSDRDLFASAEPETLRILIGEEHGTKELTEFSTVARAWGKDDAHAGVALAIGPTRMHYERVVPAVMRIAERLTEYVR